MQDEPKPRLILRRRIAVPDRESPREIADAGEPFSSLPIGAVFYIRPRKFIGIAFVKTGEHMAEIETWDECGYMQSFDLAMMVYPVRHSRTKTINSA